MKREIVIKDTQIVWKYLAEHEVERPIYGSVKGKAIEILFSEGRISKGDYYLDCPLCQEFLFREERDNKCTRCPWPVYPDHLEGYWCRCEHTDSPYFRWREDNTNQTLARKVYELTLTFK